MLTTQIACGLYVSLTHSVHHVGCKVVGHDSALERRKRKDRRVLQDWARLCKRLSTAIEPGQLELTLIANTDEEDFAADLVKPLRTLPTLRACAVSLSKRHNTDIAQLADEACLRAMGYPESRITEPFNFRGLPDELQLEVLRNTGLKAPYHLWCDRRRPGTPKYCDYPLSNQCIYQADVVDKNGCVMCCTGDRAHSAANPTCNCWVLSMSPLQVDRKMRQMAKNVLYQENTWVLDLTDFVNHNGYFDGYWEDLLSQARHLQIHASTNDTLEAYDQTGYRWKAFMHQLQKMHVAPNLLTLSLVMLHPNHRWRPQRLSDPVTRSVWEGWEWRGHRLFAHRARSLFQDFHPKDVFVRILRRHHIAGLGSAEWQEKTRYESPVCDQQHFEEQEREMERVMMNNPDYDTRLRPKSKMIHEASGDLREVLEPGVNSWKPFSHEDSCAQCGWASGA